MIIKSSMWENKKGICTITSKIKFKNVDKDGTKFSIIKRQKTNNRILAAEASTELLPLP